MAYSNTRKMGHRQMHAAASQIDRLQQRLNLMEQIIIKLLARHDLLLGMDKNGEFDLVLAPPVVPDSPELEVRVVDEAEVAADAA